MDENAAAPGVVRARTRPAPAVLVLAAVLGAGFAHTELKESDPAEDAVLTGSPAAITLTYTTDVRLALSTVSVRPTALADGAPGQRQGELCILGAKSGGVAVARNETGQSAPDGPGAGPRNPRDWI